MYILLFLGVFSNILWYCVLCVQQYVVQNPLHSNSKINLHLSALGKKVKV